MVCFRGWRCKFVAGVAGRARSDRQCRDGPWAVSGAERTVAPVSTSGRDVRASLQSPRRRGGSVKGVTRRGDAPRGVSTFGFAWQRRPLMLFQAGLPQRLPLLVEVRWRLGLPPRLSTEVGRPAGFHLASPSKSEGAGRSSERQGKFPRASLLFGEAPKFSPARGKTSAAWRKLPRRSLNLRRGSEVFPGAAENFQGPGKTSAWLLSFRGGSEVFPAAAENFRGPGKSFARLLTFQERLLSFP
jgi:hypothetical protein